MARTGTVLRNTKETQIEVVVNLDGGDVNVKTGIGFFDHMLTAFGFYAKIGLTVQATGDLYVDGHHTVEDVGICLGLALKQALGDRAGIRRFGSCYVPMDEALTFTALDFSNRPYLVFDASMPQERIGEYDSCLTVEFMRALAMNAGIDIAIGDFVFEFDSVEMPYQPGLLMDCYAKALQGYDIVWACPRCSRHGRRQLFYRIFNASFDSAYRMREDAFRLVSRRALNRVHAISSMPPYRKAAYAASGLKLDNLEFEPSFPPRQKDKNPYTKALDSLALYTDMFYRLSLGISLVLLVLTMAFGIYTVVIYASPVRQVEGWTSTMLVMCVGFFGIFLMLTIVIKYLSLLVDLVCKKQRYLVEGIEKIQR